jgi:hypothetical protein
MDVSQSQLGPDGIGIRFTGTAFDAVGLVGWSLSLQTLDGETQSILDFGSLNQTEFMLDWTWNGLVGPNQILEAGEYQIAWTVLDRGENRTISLQPLTILP